MIWNSRIKSMAWFCVTVILLIPLMTRTASGVPKIINHQGRLMDGAGELLGGEGTDFCFKFSIYDDGVVGIPDNKLWPSGSPSVMTATVKEGIFNIGIGDTSAGGDALDFNFQDYDGIFLNVEVADKVGATCNSGDGAESFENLSPRQRIFSSGYAVNADSVDGFHAAQSATDNQIPVLSSGNLILGANGAQVNVTSGTLYIQGDVSSGNLLLNAFSGWIGVGTADPRGKLHIAGNGGIMNLEGTDHVYAQFYPDGFAAGRKAWLGFGDSADNNLTIANQIDGSHIILSPNNGNVGIGTSTPQQKLHLVNGSILQDSPNDPKIIGGQNLTLPGGGAMQVFVSGNYAYLIFDNAAGTDILRVIDISNPANPSVAGGNYLNLPGHPRSIYVVGRYAYVTFDNSSGTDVFRIIDISNPVYPYVVGGGGISLPANGQNITVNGRYAYLTFDNPSGTSTFRVVDILNPYNPKEVGGQTLSLPSAPRQIAVNGQYAYVVFYATNSAEAFRVIDISNPSSPYVVSGGSLNLGYSGWSLSVSGRYAYIGFDNAAGTDIFRVVDISNPNNPVIAGGSNLSLPGFAKTLSVSGRYAYIGFDNAAGTDIFRVVDISNPNNPIIVGGNNLNLPGLVKSISSDGRYAYMGFYQGSGTDILRVVDITGIEAVAAIIHSLKAGLLQITASARINDQLVVGDGLIVGNGLKADGEVGINGLLRINATSTLNRSPLEIVYGGSDSFIKLKNIFDVEQFQVDFQGRVFANAFLSRYMQFNEDFVRVHSTITADTAGGGTTGLGDNFSWGTGELRTCTWSNIDDAINGIMRQSTGAVRSGCLTYLSAGVGNAQLILNVNYQPVMAVKLKPDVIGANNWLLAGMMDYTDGSLSDPTNGVYFSSEDAAVWTGVVKNGGTKNTVACSGQTILTNQYAYLQILAGSTTVEFWVDNDVSDGIVLQSCGAIQTDIPTVNLTAEILNQSRTGGTASMAVDIDTVRIAQDDPVVNNEATPEISLAESEDDLEFDLINRADIAEEIPVLLPDDIESGDVIALVKGRKVLVEKTHRAYDSNLYGVISSHPGLILGEGMENSARVALIGRVLVKINLDNGPIEVGDWLTSSNEAGVAMKADKTGMVLGRALEPYDGGSSDRKILMSVETQFRLDKDACPPQNREFDENEKNTQDSGVINKISETFLKLGRLVVEALEVEYLKALRLEIGSESAPAGFSLYDTSTNKPYCISVDNGEIKKEEGHCQIRSAPPIKENNNDEFVE